MSDKVAKVNLINVHELGPIKTKDATEVAKHAYFMAANMLVAVRKHVRAKGVGHDRFLWGCFFAWCRLAMGRAFLSETQLRSSSW